MSGIKKKTFKKKNTPIEKLSVTMFKQMQYRITITSMATTTTTTDAHL
jgi:hypothetical protein